MMDQQKNLEEQYRLRTSGADTPPDDPYPRMIIVCIAITMVLLIVIVGCIFVDFVILRPGQNIRATPSVQRAQPEPDAQAPAASENNGA